MAEPREPSESERLLAEVEGMLGDGPRPQRSVQPHGAAEAQPGWIVSQLRAATLAGAVSAVGVWVLFALLPFLGATSGGIGAFLAAFAATLLFRRRRR
jgi:hypothetical protein